MTCYTPSEIAGTYPTPAAMIALFDAEGMQTGFRYWTTGQAIFASEPAFLAGLRNEGFFTGCFPHKYYSPAQATAMTDGAIWAAMNGEGVTTGNWAAGATCHPPGEDQCTIIQALQGEGYVTGCPEMIAPADNALADSQCIDGRCYATCCLAPNWFLLAVTVDGECGLGDAWQAYQTDTATVTFDCPTTAWIWMTRGVTLVPCGFVSEGYQVEVWANGVQVPNLSFFVAPGGGNLASMDSQALANMATLDIAAGVATTFELRARRAERGSHFTALANILFFKQTCSPVT